MAEPIAIIGIGCRFPGADNPQEYWQLLRQGVHAITEIPAERWNVNEFYDPEPGQPGKMSTRYGGFLKQVDQFDADFFGISPREAERMDPQQRLVLEVAWEAIENAGMSPTSLAGSQTGVFVGVGNYDYGLLSSNDVSSINAYDGIGNTLSITANRLSYLLDLRGLSLSMETACSSSLVAVHMACQSLRAHETDLTIVGAVSLMLSPEQTITYSQARMLASDGRCKTFDADADGYVRGEGCGVVMLKRLSDALRDGDRIQAVIRGSAVNQDGLSNGLTAPNGPAQQAVIRKALENADVAPDRISYVEAHGTGTSLGDPIEVRSLKSVLMADRSEDQPCWIGSVKTNVGHLEAAAGMAGLLKVILALQHREIPPHLHLKKLNPYISLEGTPFAIPTDLQPWQSDEPRLAGISSFGFGGTNAHIILEEAPVATSLNLLDSSANGHPFLLPLSGKSESALKALAQRYADALKTEELALPDLCYTASIGRAHFDHRCALWADSRAQLHYRLNNFAETGVVEQGAAGQIKSRRKTKVAFLFTGQGSQYADMGRELFESCPVLRHTVEECDRILRPYLDTPLLEVLYGKATHLLDQTAYTQPALFSLEYALAQLWQHWGITPAALIGHSVGEFVAACIAGVFSLEDGLKLIAHRGRLMQALPSNGAMLAALASVDQIQPYLDSADGVLTLAGHNGPSSVVLSGETDAIDALEAELSKADIKTKRLVVSHAFHSSLMEPMVAEFRKVAESITYSAPQLPLVSNLTGQVIDGEMTADYWCEHILKPVRFAEGMAALSQLKLSALLEMGPHPMLLGMGRTCVPTDWAERVSWLPSLRRGQSSNWGTMLDAAAELYVRGATLDWQALSDGPRQRLMLPTYPFQRQRYWVGSTTPKKTSQNFDLPVETTSILSLLQQGEIEQVNQQIADFMSLSGRHQEVLPELLSALVQLHRQQQQQQQAKDLMYGVEWKPRPDLFEEILPKAHHGKHFLIFADATGTAAAMASWLRQQQQTVSLVFLGESYQKIGDTTWQIDPTQPDGLKHLLETVQQEQGDFQKILHFWSLDMTPGADLDVDALEQSQVVICQGTLLLLQALTQLNMPQPKCWWITRGAIDYPDQLPDLVQAPLWGMGRAIALEYPEFWSGLIDLDPTHQTTDMSDVWKVTIAAHGEDQLVFRAGKPCVARLVPQALTEIQPVSIDASGCYWITGGLGGLGLRIAQWLAEKGARHLVLIGRRQPSTEAQEVIQQLEETGITVQVAQADVTASKDLKRLLSETPTVKGVVHAAGVVEYRPMPEMTPEQFARVLKPKVTGGWLLHQTLLNEPLDFFVAFSSIAAVWGSKGQAHYAAANYFLDTLMHYRHRSGLPALSVNWGPWAGGGMASSEAETWLARMGISLLNPDQALTTLEILLGTQRVQATVADVDWQRFKLLYEARESRPFLQEISLLSREDSQANGSQPSTQQSAIRQTLEQAPVSERLSLLIDYLQSEVARILGKESSQMTDSHLGFFEMGMDSLMAVELKARLESDLACALPGTLAFEAPTIGDMANYLAQHIFDWSEEQQPEETGAQSTQATEKSELVLEVSQLSQDELEDSLEQELAGLEALLNGA